MKYNRNRHGSFLVLACLQAVLAQSSIAGASCSPTLTASYAAPSVADGYIARLVANNLTKPRGIKFDSQGTLLVVEQGSGITALSLIDSGKECISVGTRKTVINDTTVSLQRSKISRMEIR